MRVQLFLSVLLFCVLYVSSQQFTVDLSQPTTPFAHYWEECVGSGHALLGMRADWQRHLTQAHGDIGFKQVRFHGLFDDDMSAVLFNNGEITYSFFNIDTVFDFLVSIGMRPYVELSFMPEVFASGTATVMHYKGLTSPPKNYTQWEDFISSFAEHIIDRYGWDEISQWSFEVWNEPNCGFFNGTQDEYYTLFQHTSYAMKRVNSGLRVGGPVTCQSAYLTDFMNFCKANNVAYDFVATHEYPTDYNPSNRDILYEIFTKSRSEVGDDVKLYYSEFNDGLYANPAYHDTPYASAFLFHILHKVQGIVDLLSWWTFTDIFEEQGQISQPYFGVNGWGLLMPKPSYRAFQQLGTAEVPVTTTTANSTTNVYAVLSQDGLSLDIIAYNFDLPDSAIQNETVTIVLSNLKNLPSVSVAAVYRIDDTHANAPATWIAQGSPDYPTIAQIQQQLEASELVEETLQPQKVSATSVQFTLELPKWGSAFLSVSLVMRRHKQLAEKLNTTKQELTETVPMADYAGSTE